MTKKKKTQATAAVPKPIVNPVFPAVSFPVMAVIIACVGFVFYFNTLFNEYTLDDGIVITANHFTQKGFAGIRDIFAHDTFASVEGVAGELTGGRYRPLSVATFAMEVGLFGKNNPFLSHLFNVLIYCLLCVTLLYFLAKYLFPKQPLLAFLSTFIFTIHPIHTEAVASIKGRDELLALLFMLFSLILFFSHVMHKKNYLRLGLSFVAFFLSMLSKENGVTYIALIPLMLFFFGGKSLKDSILSCIPFLVITILFLWMRTAIVGLPVSNTKEVMNAPFLLATGVEKIATKTLILGKYLLLLIFPHPLSYDYSYKQIPYVGFSDPGFLVSLLVNGALIVFALLFFARKNILSFSILFYFIALSVVSNFVFDVGSPMNDRFLFQPSIGFAVALGYFFWWVSGNERAGSVSARKGIITSLLGLIFILSAFKTISRNADWKDDPTLFRADAEHAPNSAKTNGHCAVSYINLATPEKDPQKKNELFVLSLEKLKRAIEIYPGYADPYINLGNIYAQQDKLDEAREALFKARSIVPGNNVMLQNLRYLSDKYLKLGEKNYAEKDFDSAIHNTELSIECNPNVKAYYNLGGYYLTKGDKEKAKELWTKALALDPGNPEIKKWLGIISGPDPVKK